ncbi:OmpA family protein [Hymenobacter weizhouensis]|uniref:OmpA family protein n=1 Tax=Hymenobacter sp. YIM 151500-1 TaxID=2987689 RepID=UPI002225CA53|nr:OmpA family protein [Hymenobacter sp. YIM 151500-1]UYZ63900.1 OmpA family protein [Hymenobacter sp. YIM 151500-1]
MRSILLLIVVGLVVAWLPMQAQMAAAWQTYTDAGTGYQLSYPHGWQVHEGETRPDVSFYVGPSWQTTPAAVSFSVRPLSDRRKDLNLLAAGQADSVALALVALPRAQILHLEQYDAGRHQEVRYDYTYAAAPPATGRTRVVGRRLWRGGYEYRIEYQATTEQNGRYLAAGRRLVESFAFVGQGLPSRRYLDQRCDDKMYAIAALRTTDGRVEDDCRTIHEFATADPATLAKVHRRVLPFQSYALAKGFDNNLYSVTKAPTDRPEYVYCYDPATRQGRYTTWQLPAQGPENFWISAATDQRGDLYFITSNASLLVRVNPPTGAVTVVWTADPLRKAAYYPAIGFTGAGTHANFCLDDTNTLYEVYSTDGALLKIDLLTQQPAPELIPLDGLPKLGGYSDILLQHDTGGRRWLYLAGPKSLYKVDLARRYATRLRRGVYTDLAGCNLFRPAARPTPPPPPTTSTWRGRVLDATTFQPLPQAQLRLRGNESETLTTVPLGPDGSFSFAAKSGHAYGALVRLSGYLSADSTYIARPGPYVQDILLRPVAVGATLALNNVQFEQGQAVLLPSSLPALNQLVALLTTNPTMTIELRGHTDNVGDPQKNVVLSEQRVAAVKAYLVGRGIAEGRITGLGFGGAQPRASNAQEATRQLNRRVEFRVTGR